MAKRIWMYWPDDMACQFKENVEKGFMACELPDNREVGDLDVLMNKRGGLDAALKEAYGPGRRIADGRKLLREFANVMQIGDYILARNEFFSIVGVGIVASDYYYDATRSKFRHCRKVNWIDTQVRPFPEGLKRSGKWRRVTIINMPYREIAEQIISSVSGGEGACLDVDNEGTYSAN